jgi:DNA-binding MarR family transcriptional regulator
MHASRLVGVVDGMESLGLVKRKGNPEDRRSYSLEITPAGRERMGEVGKVAYEHNEAMCAGLSIDERVALVSLLQRIADRQGLLGGVHPGFRDLGGNRERVVASRATRATATAIPE